MEESPVTMFRYGGVGMQLSGRIVEIPEIPDGDNEEQQLLDDNITEDSEDENEDLLIPDDNKPFNSDSADDSKEKLSLKDVIISLIRGKVNFQEAFQQITTIILGI